MDALEAMLTRRSIRAFSDEPVTESQLEVIMRAAMAAPSAGNEQPWRFVVVREPETLQRLSRATPFAKPLARAALGIVVAADRRSLKYPGFYPVDCAAATQNALLAAHAQGLGGVWIGVHPIWPFEAAVRRIVGLPRKMRPMSLLALGHPAQSRSPVERYHPEWVHAERWGEALTVESLQPQRED